MNKLSSPTNASSIQKLVDKTLFSRKSWNIFQELQKFKKYHKTIEEREER